jgi:hypothetical protein
MPPETTLTLTDAIAGGAFLVAILSAIYARGARLAAERANQIATRESLRPLRLQVYRAMHQFAHYCSTYLTLYHLQQVKGTRDLTDRIDSFKWEIEQHGLLGMPEVDERARQFVNGAWKMQRLIDRMAGGQNNPHDPPYATAQDNLHGLIDWFAEERRGLKELFAPYMSAA